MKMSESKTTFSDLKLNPWLVRQCTSIGVKTPTLIQSNCIPEILRGKDVIGAAKTGSGKTLAFALPILQRLCEDPYGIFALILTPTRELAYQIADQFALIGKPMNLKHCVVVGGMDMVNQGRELAKKPHVVVATPGRLADHIDSCDTFSLFRIQFLVLDEADRLLGGHFDDQIKTVFRVLPKQKQCLFFSATITDTLEKLRGVTDTEVFLYEAPAEVATVEGLKQHYVLTPHDIRDAYLVETIRTFRSSNSTGNIMVFTGTCKKCQILSMTLNEVGFENVALHAMIPQQQRLAALARFKSNTVKMLIATDVASRGLDIPTVQLVLNHNVPSVPKDYIHRVGRTARAGRGGLAVTLVGPYDLSALHAIENLIKTKLTEYKIDGNFNAELSTEKELLESPSQVNILRNNVQLHYFKGHKNYSLSGSLDSEVGKIFTQISVTESEAHIKLDETDFYERRLINLRKKWILEGLDPDREEAKLLGKNKKFGKLRKRKKPKKPETENDQA